MSTIVPTDDHLEILMHPLKMSRHWCRKVYYTVYKMLKLLIKQRWYGKVCL